jgi:protein arginine kinase activator
MSDRPQECSKCVNKCDIEYKQIKQGVIQTTNMCQNCPILKQKIFGEEPVDTAIVKASCTEASLCCMGCGSSIQTIKLGKTLGCSECYSVFQDFILKVLETTDLIPEKLKEILHQKNKIELHIGKTPIESLKLPVGSQLNDLTLALDEALKKENYEQAAKIRDQIKQLKDISS